MMKTTRRALLIALPLGTLLLSLLAASAQDASPDKNRKREKFGSSLKRLKWDPVKKAAVEVKPKTTSRASDEGAIQLKTLLVVFDVLVTDADKRHIVGGLTKDDFILLEDDQPQQISTFLRGDDQRLPKSIVLILDWSGSQIPYFDKSLAAAKTLISELGPKDEMAIVTDDIDLLTDYTADKAKLAAVLDSFAKRTRPDKDPTHRRFAGHSRQLSALLATLRELVEVQERRPIIIFQSDGDESTRLIGGPDQGLVQGDLPQFALTDIYSAAENSRATIYSVITNEQLVGVPRDVALEHGRHIFESNRPEYLSGEKVPSLREIQTLTERLAQGQAAMVRVAASSGAWATFLEKPEDAQKIYGQILSDMNNRYVLGYYPSNVARDGAVRKVNIAVKSHPEYTVIGRTKYQAPGNSEVAH
jgi:VWFA-related protein